MTERQHWWSGHWQEHLTQGSISFRDHDALILAAERMLGGYQGKKILEVGSGRGIDSLRMAQRGATAYCIDLTRQALQITVSISGDTRSKIHPLQADAERLPFRDESFDLVFSQGVMEHLGETRKMLLEQSRVARRGGYVLVDVPSRYSLQTVTRGVQLLLGRWPYGKEYPYSPQSLQSTVEQVGLEPVKFYGRGLVPIVYLPADSWVRRTPLFHKTSGQVGGLDRPHPAGIFTKFTRYIEVTLGHWFLNNLGIIARKP